MRTDKQVAFSLRRQGKSYNEITAVLGVSKSTLSSWFKGVDFSKEIKDSLSRRVYKESSLRLKSLNAVRGELLSAYYDQAAQEAQIELDLHCKDPLFVSGIMLYWGEGDKLHKNHTRFTNTDPAMLKLFVAFLIKYGGFKKSDMRLAIFIYKDLGIEECKQYWLEQTGISNLHKPMILPSREKHRKLLYGTASVIVMNTYFKKKLLLWIDQMPKMVLNTVPSQEA